MAPRTGGPVRAEAYEALQRGREVAWLGGQESKKVSTSLGQEATRASTSPWQVTLKASTSLTSGFGALAAKGLWARGSRALHIPEAGPPGGYHILDLLRTRLQASHRVTQ